MAFFWVNWLLEGFNLVLCRVSLAICCWIHSQALLVVLSFQLLVHGVKFIWRFDLQRFQSPKYDLTHGDHGNLRRASQQLR